MPDHVSLWGSLIQFRRQFEQYVCLRRQVNARSSVTSGGREVGDIDFYVVRENSEGEYSSVGGIMNEGTEQELCCRNRCLLVGALIGS